MGEDTLVTERLHDDEPKQKVCGDDGAGHDDKLQADPNPNGSELRISGEWAGGPQREMRVWGGGWRTIARKRHVTEVYDSSLMTTNVPSTSRSRGFGLRAMRLTCVARPSNITPRTAHACVCCALQLQSRTLRRRVAQRFGNARSGTRTRGNESSAQHRSSTVRGKHRRPVGAAHVTDAGVYRSELREVVDHEDHPK